MPDDRRVEDTVLAIIMWVTMIVVAAIVLKNSVLLRMDKEILQEQAVQQDYLISALCERISVLDPEDTMDTQECVK